MRLWIKNALFPVSVWLKFGSRDATWCFLVYLIRNAKLVIVNVSHFTQFWNQSALITFPESLYQTRNWPVSAKMH